jgi:DNA repair protein RecO
LGNIASAVTEHYHTEIKSNPEVLAKVLESVGHFERLVGLEERDVELFLLLQNYLEAMEEIAAKGLSAEARLLNQGFLFQLLSELGYHLEVYRCAVSGVPLVSEGRYCFSAEAGGVVSVEEAARFRNALALSSNAIKLIRIFFHNKLSSLKKVKVDEATLSQVERVSRAFLMWIGH